MALIKSENTALVLIDVQQGFDSSYWGTRNNLGAESNMEKLLLQWRKKKMPVIHVKHNSTELASPLRPGQVGNNFKSEVEPKEQEHVEEKNVNSALIGTGLEKYLRSHEIETIVLVGLTTDHCVSTTARMAANLGFEVLVVADATATFNRTAFDGTNLDADQVHKFALASLHREFATIINTAQLLKALGAFSYA